MTVSQDRDKPGNDHYAAMHAGFRWPVPARFNIAQVCCRRWAEAASGAGITPETIAARGRRMLGQSPLDHQNSPERSPDRLSTRRPPYSMRISPRACKVDSASFTRWRDSPTR